MRAKSSVVDESRVNTMLAVVVSGDHQHGVSFIDNNHIIEEMPSGLIAILLYSIPIKGIQRTRCHQVLKHRDW